MSLNRKEYYDQKEAPECCRWMTFKEQGRLWWLTAWEAERPLQVFLPLTSGEFKTFQVLFLHYFFSHMQLPFFNLLWLWNIFAVCYLLLMFIYFVIIRFKLCVLFFSKSKVNIFIIKFSPGLEFLKIPHLLLTFWKSLGPHTLYDFLDYILVIGFSLYSQLYFLLLFLNSSYHFLIPTPIINFHLFKEIKKILDRFLHVLL